MLRSTRCTNLTGSQPFDQSDRFGGWSVRFKDCTVYATMVVEDQSEGMGSNTSTVAGNFNSMADAKLRSEIPVKEIYSIGNYHSPKVRKPYTIKKQREKWTEDEHQKFLEALKLYGRGWRQIEEHVGTKTAVQIRSHAQKFFSKVVRGSSGSSEASMKSIEIPPPRPKRKPMHPYPRKSVDFLKGASVSNQPERSSSPNFSVGEEGTNSPTSVLSTLGSEGMGSTASDQHKGSPSSTVCTTDMHSPSLSPEKENDYMTSNSSAEEEGRGSSPISESVLCTKFESVTKDTVCAKEEATEASASTSIKLFGRTFSLLDPQKDSFPGAEDFKLSTSKTDQANLDFENEKIVQTLPLDKLDTQLSLSGVGNWNTLACCAPVNQMEYQKESPNCTESDQPLLWWTLYQVPFYYLSAYNQNAVQTSPNSCVDERMKDKERSCTDSNEGSFGVENVGEKNMETVDSLCREPRVEESVSPSSSRKGFVPYKRCLAERDMKSPVIVLEERKRQRARVCS
ncbi:hypothetical protein FNV43_RR21103 [Rhamnella rubrinervis]|uniref:Uncharacterized protein n=1 Tax=Rhamnella rubrinervis TaxID=2594499 RepID=A0A8K0GUT0_9ROSA|nr:hypothetical protein FNV43_RR21103 [Rhamnella rubrinervis]